MLVLGIDPGSKPGYSVWNSTGSVIVWAGVEPPPYPVDVAVVERGFPHGDIGRDGHWGLGFGAGWRLCAADAAVKYTIAPKAWRAALGGLPANAPKEVIVARLRVLRYRSYADASADAGRWTDDVVEACGIAEASALILARPLKRDRKELKEVRR